MSGAPPSYDDPLIDLIATVRLLIQEEARELKLLRQQLARHSQRVTWRHWAILAGLAVVGTAGPIAAHSAFSAVAREVAAETRLMEQASRRWDDVLVMGRILHADDLIQNEREKVLVNRIQELSRNAERHRRGR